MNLLSDWRKLRTLPRGSMRDLASAGFWVLVSNVALRCISLAHLQQALLRIEHAHANTIDAAHAQHLSRLLDIAAHRLPVRSTCLTRSLALAWMLRRRGAAAHVRIGVRFASGTLDAHAWVELDGQPVNDRADVSTRFAAFDQIVPAAAFRP
jgi:hypothetical protein